MGAWFVEFGCVGRGLISNTCVIGSTTMSPSHTGSSFSSGASRSVSDIVIVVCPLDVPSVDLSGTSPSATLHPPHSSTSSSLSGQGLMPLSVWGPVLAWVWPSAAPVKVTTTHGFPKIFPSILVKIFCESNLKNEGFSPDFEGN